MFAFAFRSLRLNRSLALVRRGNLLFVAAAIACLVCLPPLSAHAVDEAPLDLTALQQLEMKASQSAPRDQAFLYAEVLHGLTELAGRQMTAGDDDKAVVTLKLADVIAARLHDLSLRDARRLKNAELLLEHTTRRLTDMVRAASAEERDTMQPVLKHFNSVHDDVLAALFSK